MSAMPNPTTLFVGLDSHKDFISAAHAEAASTDPPVFVGGIGTRQADIDKLVRRLHSKASHLVFAYEAGPTGYGLYRYLRGKGEECHVIAPSLIPKRSGVTTWRLRRSSAPAPARPTRLVVRCRRIRLSPDEKRTDVDVTTRLGAPHPLLVLPRPPPGDVQRSPTS
jgi:transposase